jgi:DNA-directed RNA polymerase specialized sigma24 family protein
MKIETYNFIYSFLPFAEIKCRSIEDAEDLMQDVTLRILGRVGWFEALTRRQQTGYIKRSICNRYVDFVRSKVYRDRRRLRLPKSTNPVIFFKMELKEVMKKAQQRLDTCTPLFLLLEGYSVREIAEIEGKSQNAVGLSCFRARKFLNSK